MNVEGTPLLRAGMKVSPLHMEIPGTDRLGTQAVKQGHLCPRCYTYWRGIKNRKWNWKKKIIFKSNLNIKLLWNHSALFDLCVSNNSQSAFFKDCFFLEGLEMTLILLLKKTPMLALFPYNIFTDSMKCFLLSESLIYSVLAVQKCYPGRRQRLGDFYFCFSHISYWRTGSLAASVQCENMPMCSNISYSVNMVNKVGFWFSWFLQQPTGEIAQQSICISDPCGYFCYFA